MTIEFLIILFLLISFFFSLFYQLFFFIKITFHSNNISSDKGVISSFNDKNVGLSIIICAKNELENLKKNLPNIIDQNELSIVFNDSHFNFKSEIIVVNDQSTDDSLNYLQTLEKQHDCLKIVNIDRSVNHSEGKKFALTLGIKTAKFDYLLMTDADCFPKSQNWSNIIFKALLSNNNDLDVILGYSPYRKQKGILNKLIRFDIFVVAQNYLSYALRNLTYMGVGRNLAYKKKIFFDNKGFASHIHIPSGDDDLFIQEVSSDKNIKIGVEFSRDTHMVSEVTNNWKDWIYQKRRHLSTSSFYKIKFKILLMIYPLSQIFFLISLIFAFLFKLNIVFVFTVLFLKLLISYTVNYKSMRTLDVRDLYLLHPFYEVLHLFIQANFVILSIFHKTKKWNRK